MNNPRDNRTTSERAWYDHEYTLALDLIDEQGRPTRFWFRDASDRRAFADLFNTLRGDHNHQTSAVPR